MNLRNVVTVVVVIAVVLWLVLPTGNEEETPKHYSETLQKERREKDQYMADSEESPLRHDSTFTGLKYFPPDINFKVIADLEPISSKKVVVLPTSDGQQKQYREYAYATFRLAGAQHRLLILEVLDSGPFRGTLFLAFADDTSADETYGAGRYLDLKKVPGAATITLDFNRAYNPYCAYADEFSCPLPPKENILNVAITAGEKNYH